MTYGLKSYNISEGVECNMKRMAEEELIEYFKEEDFLDDFGSE